MELVVLLLGLAFLLGLKHSFDVDHILAVSGFLQRSPNTRQTLRLSAAWAGGHMLTASVITFLLFTFSRFVLQPLLGQLELIVAIMLIVLGILTFRHWRRRNHDQPDVSSEHDLKKVAGVGIIHGLASNDELLLLLVLALGFGTYLMLGVGLLLFTLGVALGMTIWGMMVALPARRSRAWVGSALTLGIATLSILYGIYLLISGSDLIGMGSLQ